VIGKIPYLNSVPFYVNLEQRRFKILPVTPRRMGVLMANGQLDAGLFSLANYLEHHHQLWQLGYCIATRDQVKSVLLFSNEGWRDLDNKTIGIMDDTATSVKLLKVLLEKKYGVRAVFKRMNTGINDYREYDAVLLIGDEALQQRKTGIAGFELMYDLATEWYEWKKLPFVFAVWAVRMTMPQREREELEEIIRISLEKAEQDYKQVSMLHAKRIQLPLDEAAEYLDGFNFRLGERECAAIAEFERILIDMKELERA
jgi:chorismate dehydratase